jgi:predicted RNA-binding Zn ribbon-like protein
MPAGVRQLTGPDGQRYSFDPGSFCLELLLTGGPGDYTRHEILHTPADLVRWLVDSRLAALAPLPADALRVRPVELRRLRRFRDTMWSVACGLVRGEAVAAAALEVVNDSAAAAPPVPRVDPDTGRRGWVGPVTGAQVLSAAAREAIDLLTGPGRDRVRECAAADCHLVFLDTSRPGSRRWCSMERCGNRHKVRGYRSRLAGR